MPRELAIALCLVAIIEGLFLFAAPQAWQRMAQQLAAVEPRKLRAWGGVAVIVGLVMLQAVR
ncbi:MAG TPA: DUF2065 family protein [Xanthomonadales bacterium]|nr:DUF2065 family protein [Xanthomonadales bacterium]